MCDYINHREMKQRELAPQSPHPEDKDLWAQVHQLKEVIQSVRKIVDEMKQCKEYRGQICDVCLSHSIELENALNG
jgi:hypothetical protein